MEIISERIRRGVPGFPLGYYDQTRKQANVCVTPLHYHYDLEFLLPITGDTILVVGGEQVLLQPGQLGFLSPGEVHALYSGAANCNFRCIVLPREVLALPAENPVQKHLLTPLYEGRLQLKRQTQDKQVLELLWNITELCKNMQENCVQLTAMLLQLLDLYRQKGLIQDGDSMKNTPIHTAISYMQTHLEDQVTLDAIAASVGMSAKYFCTYFKKRTGSTPITYLTSLRIRRAQYLLRMEQLTVGETATACGFDNLSFFIKTFKAATGQTPGQYRLNT